MFVPIKILQTADNSIEKEIIFVNVTLQDAMITYEEYNKKKDDEAEDNNTKLPIPVLVVIIVLASLIGIFIVCEAIFGL